MRLESSEQRASPRARSLGDGDAPAPLWAVVWGYLSICDWEDLLYSCRQMRVTMFSVERELERFLQKLSYAKGTRLLCRGEATVTS